MKLTLKFLRLNDYTHCEEEADPRASKYGFWRIVEHTAAGWFPRPTLYTDKEKARAALAKLLERQ